MTGEIRYELKLRSITLDWDTCTRLHHDKFIEMSKKVAVGQCNQGIIVDKNLNFVVDRNRQGICTVPMKKTLNASMKKNVQLGRELVPFGWQPCTVCTHDLGLPRTLCICEDQETDNQLPHMIPTPETRYLSPSVEEFPEFLRE